MKDLTIKDLRQEIVLVSALFLVALLAGILQAGNPPSVVMMVLGQIQELANSLAGGSNLDFFIAIFINNAIAVFSIAIGGILLGLSPFISTIINGYVIGVVSGLAILEGHGLALLVGLVPHGIIEIPMLILALANGLRLGRISWHALKTKSIKLLWPATKRALRFTWKTLLPLVLVAAIIEAFVSSYLLSLISG